MTLDWDPHNRSKVEAHGVTPEAFEQVVSDPNSTTLPQPHKDEPRWMTVGTATGKRIVAVWTIRGEAIRPITAWFESRPRKRI